MDKKENYSMIMTLEEILFFAFFILLSVTKGLGFYEGKKVFELAVLVASVFGLAKVLVTPYTKKQWVLQTVLLLIVMVVFFRSREQGILFLGFLILGMKNISVKKVFHVGLWVWSVCAVVLSVFSFFRLERTVYRVHAKMGLGHIFRWSLGFTHPNTLHITYLALCAFILYEMRERYRFRHFVYLMIGNLLVFFYSVSYTGFGVVAVLLTGCLYVQLRPRFWIFGKFLANLVLPACLFLSFVCPVALFFPPVEVWVQKLNFMLNTRIWLARQFLVPEYISLFGVNIKQVTGPSMTMDNSYIWGFVNYGIIPFTIIIIGYFILLADCTRKQRTRELVILACFFVAGWTEPLFFNTSFKNITQIFLGELLFRQKEGEKEYCLVEKLRGRSFEVPLAALPDRLFRAVWKVFGEQKKQTALFIASGAVLGILLCGIFYRVPAGYVVPRFYTDALDYDIRYLESKEDAAYEGYKVMNYTDAETPMQVVTGNAVKLETARYYMGSVFIGGIAGTLAAAAADRKRIHRLVLENAV